MIMCDLDRSASLGMLVGEYSLKNLVESALKFSFILCLKSFGILIVHVLRGSNGIFM